MSWAPCPHGVRTRGKKIVGDQHANGTGPVFLQHEHFKAYPRSQSHWGSHAVPARDDVWMGSTESRQCSEKAAKFLRCWWTSSLESKEKLAVRQSSPSHGPPTSAETAVNTQIQ